MNCEQAQTLLPDYFQDSLDGGAALEADARAELERHWRNCSECGELADFWRTLGRVDPAAGSGAGPAVGARVQLMIEAFREGQASRPENSPAPGDGRRSRHTFATLATLPRLQYGFTAAALVLGLVAGLLIGGPRGSASPDLQALQREVQATRQLVTLSLLQQQSASDRLQGITYSNSISRPEPQVTSALLETAKHDASVNVRLAAVDALQRLGREPAVRRGLAEAFRAQQSPLVQIAIIDSFAQMREPGAAALLRSLGRGGELAPVVRQRLDWAAQQAQQQ